MLQGRINLDFRRPGGFTLIELLVVIVILVILASILIPYIMNKRETANRVSCANNLRTLRTALVNYANDNGMDFPRVRHDRENNPNGYTAFTGTEDPDPFAENSTVEPNDVSASLWLLVRGGYESNLSRFVCRSAGDRPDVTPNPRQRGNFRGPSNLSYGYSSPFSSAPGYRMNDTRWGGFALLADKGPPLEVDEIGAVPEDYPAWDAPPLELARANSRNHGGAGQNVLYADGHVSFQTTPYCGVNFDNIYTAFWPTPPPEGQSPPSNQKGYWGHDIGPSHAADNYLVPHGR
jgi:prepilin-type N-terminal cleavage/methylation domain-containing protein/prepilin-type processing-associated H-X9-DG protein